MPGLAALQQSGSCSRTGRMGPRPPKSPNPPSPSQPPGPCAAVRLTICGSGWPGYRPAIPRPRGTGAGPGSPRGQAGQRKPADRGRLRNPGRLTGRGLKGRAARTNPGKLANPGKATSRERLTGRPRLTGRGTRAAGICPTGMRMAGMRTVGMRTAGVRTVGMRTAGVRTVAVRTAAVCAAGHGRPDRTGPAHGPGAAGRAGVRPGAGRRRGPLTGPGPTSRGSPVSRRSRGSSTILVTVRAERAGVEPLGGKGDLSRDVGGQPDPVAVAQACLGAGQHPVPVDERAVGRLLVADGRVSRVADGHRGMTP